MYVYIYIYVQVLCKVFTGLYKKLCKFLCGLLQQFGGLLRRLQFAHGSKELDNSTRSAIERLVSYNELGPRVQAEVKQF